MNTIQLAGCTPEPLMGYLKALGIFRLVAEQADPACRAAWRNGKLELRTSLSKDELVYFLTERYEPSPILSPWNGDGGFLKESGTSFSTIESIKSSNNNRLAPLRRSISMIEDIKILDEFGKIRLKKKELENKKKSKKITSDELEYLNTLKKKVKDLKETILYQIRTEFPDQSLGWFDTCVQVGQDGFAVAPALGSGGVDGRMEFSANFLSNCLLVLEDHNTRAWADYSLFATGLSNLRNASIGQFSPGNIGGPNATQGFEGDSTINPWDYILLIEGAPLLAGAMTRRCNTNNFAKAAFPFTVLPVAQDSESLQDKDSNTARGEVWLPLWNKFIRFRELHYIFGEGRADWSGGQSRTNIDFAKSISSYGTDRGIGAFSRHGFLQRSGLAFLATPLGHFEVKAQPHIDLLREADPWIDRFRRACGDKTPARFSTARRRMDTAVFDYCRFGGKERFQAILIALGQAERETANGPKFRKPAKGPELRPLQRLSVNWLTASDDGSPEFEIAAALAGIKGTKGYPGIRANLEPVRWEKGGYSWDDNSALLVWKRGSLAENLCAVLERRLMDYKRVNLPYPPIVSHRKVSPTSIARFINGELDDDKIEDLLYGLVCCETEWKTVSTASDEVPRSYALLKTCFPGVNPDGNHPKGVSTNFWDKIRTIRPEARIASLTGGDRLDEALRCATQRLRSTELTPAPIEWETESFGLDSTRLAASLLFPVAPLALEKLWNLVQRKKRDEHDENVS